jgi:isopentenyldiphosphate isomerase
MKEEEIISLVNKFSKKLPKFPDGRIDYSKSETSFVLTVFIKFKNEILILKRSSKVGIYPGKWSTVTGYLDEPIPLIKKILKELKEELEINEDIISSYKIGESFEFIDKKVNRTWIIFPAWVETKKKPKIKLDWEHSEYKWIKKEELGNYDTVPKLDLSLKKGLI